MANNARFNQDWEAQVISYGEKSLNINMAALRKALEPIGGQKRYHNEGNAWMHTLMVLNEGLTTFPENPLMHKVCLLHDIGKAFTSIRKPDGDWEYPDHAQCGSFRGILCKFLPENDPFFQVIQWYINNHIKPLYWKQKGYSMPPKSYALSQGLYERYCTPELLTKLALCDLAGSVPDPSERDAQAEIAQYLLTLEF